MLHALRPVTHGSVLGLVHGTGVGLDVLEAFCSFPYCDNNVPRITRNGIVGLVET